MSIWVKGIVNWQSREVINDGVNWHEISEGDPDVLFIDGKLSYRLIMNDNKEPAVIQIKE